MSTPAGAPESAPPPLRLAGPIVLLALVLVIGALAATIWFSVR